METTFLARITSLQSVVLAVQVQVSLEYVNDILKTNLESVGDRMSYQHSCFPLEHLEAVVLLF